MRFVKKGKLSPLYICPFEVLERVGEVAYRIALPPILSRMHPVFHVFMLRKYYEDLSHVLDFSSVQLEKGLTYDEVPVAVLDRQDGKLRSKNIASVKVKWRGHVLLEQLGRHQYPRPGLREAEAEVEPEGP
nr:uncharacterized protein LOC104114749 [Nicotiana tomentosiformis]